MKLVSYAMYDCKLCNYSAPSLRKYAGHYKFHRNTPNYQFPCASEKCFRSFTCYDAYKTHVYRDHRNKGCTKNLYEQISCQEASLKCHQPLCQQKCNNLKELIAHLKGHLGKKGQNCPGQNISCPYKKCKMTFHMVTSFASHISRKHRFWSNRHLNDECFQQQVNHAALTDMQFEENDPISHENLEIEEGSHSDGDDDYPAIIKLYLYSHILENYGI